MNRNFLYWFFRYFLSFPFYLSSIVDYKKNSCLKNHLSNGKIYIFGSGNSINDHDFSILKNKNVVFLNNFIQHQDFNLIAKNNNCYYLIPPLHEPQSETEVVKYFIKLEKNIPKYVRIFLGVTPRKINAKKIVMKHSLFKNHSINYYFVSHYLSNKYNFEKPISRADAGSIYAIYLSLFFGCKNIFLIGMDHDYLNYLNTKDRQFNFYKKTSIQDVQYKSVGDSDYIIFELYRQYNIFLNYKKIRESTNASIYNCSEKGILNLFDRISIKDSFNI